MDILPYDISLETLQQRPVCEPSTRLETILYITLAFTTLCMGSCMNKDWEAPDFGNNPPYGNNEIVPSVSPSARKKGRRPSPSVGGAAQSPTDGIQLSMFKIDDPVLIKIRDQIKDLDINSLTPLQALNLLSDIKSWV